MNIDFSLQIRLSIFNDFRYNQPILSTAIDCPGRVDINSKDHLDVYYLKATYCRLKL